MAGLLGNLMALLMVSIFVTFLLIMGLTFMLIVGFMMIGAMFLIGCVTLMMVAGLVHGHIVGVALLLVVTSRDRYGYTWTS